MNNANDNPQNARRDMPGTDSLAQLAETPAIRAVHIFSQVGTLAETSRQTGISLIELSRMSREPWWQRELQGIQREQTAMENLRLSRIYGKTIDQLEQSLDHGQLTFKQGRPVMQEVENLAGEAELVPLMVPLTPDQLVKVSQAVFEQRQLVREQPTVIASSSSKLEQLAEKLRTLGQANIIDVTPEVKE
jgi:hypothetical protein